MSDEIKKEDTPQLNPLLRDATALAERIEKGTATAKTEADRLEQLQAQHLLSGTAGIRPNIELVKPTAKDYSQSIMKGKIPNV